jgi:hypothetical protein
MKDKATPPAALAALRSCTGALFRHGPNGSREYLSLATRLETGVWAGVEDRGVFPGSVYGEFCGTEVVVDLFLHVASDDGSVKEHPVRWAMRTPFAPVALLGVPGAVGDAPQLAPSAEMAWPEYQHVHRPAFGGAERWDGFVRRADRVFEGPVTGVEGSIFERPMVQTYRCGSDDASRKRAICVSADMGYPTDLHVGGAVVDDFGRLVGVIVGTSPGPERGHVGMYVPADVLVPSVAMAHASIEARHRSDRHSTGIETVQFRNSDVDWPEEPEGERQPRRRSEMLVKAVLPRVTWDRIVDQAESGYGTDASPDAYAEVAALKAAIGD